MFDHQFNARWSMPTFAADESAPMAGISSRGAASAGAAPRAQRRAGGHPQHRPSVSRVAFRVADDNSLPVIDLKDLRALLNHCAENEKDIDTKYGNVAKQSIGAFQRRLLMLEN